jgi:hypothetical protein
MGLPFVFDAAVSPVEPMKVTVIESEMYLYMMIVSSCFFFFVCNVKTFESQQSGISTTNYYHNLVSLLHLKAELCPLWYSTTTPLEMGSPLFRSEI